MFDKGKRPSCEGNAMLLEGRAGREQPGKGGSAGGRHLDAELDSPQPDQLGPHTARDRAWSCFPTSTSPLPCHSSSLLCSCCPMPSVPFPGAAPALQLGTIPRQGVLQVFMDTTCTWMATSAPQVTKMSYPDLAGCSAGLQNSPESPLLVYLPSPQPQDKPQHLGNLMASNDSGLSTLALVFELCYPSTYNPAQGDWRQNQLSFFLPSCGARGADKSTDDLTSHH
ncbi:hypothetical protein HGM15179_012393 [Zosterops borbonicus]|uniref:Uncharacterized protein n=1 Tax=Zosterops borbonicus TaxID=364589 RepID=A0A8K1G9Y7_9PASS|nr:hypothetical protein HGM15179_012393 [Zosterops borbonicus]